jgi:hypothetical protein
MHEKNMKTSIQAMTKFIYRKLIDSICQAHSRDARLIARTSIEFAVGMNAWERIKPFIRLISAAEGDHLGDKSGGHFSRHLH